MPSVTSMHTRSLSFCPRHLFRNLCSLCGDLYCSQCTAKYHVPLIYEQKGKKGPTRVCIRCRDSCLAQKEKEKGAAAAAGPAKHAVLTSTDLAKPAGSVAVRPTLIGGPGVIEIAPPMWDDADRYIDCAKCHKKGGKPHNCRTCGHLYCDACTVKMLIPPFFEKKNKTGPTRVCGECRFKILGGAKLVEHLTTGPDGRPLPLVKLGGTGDANACKVPGCTMPRVSKLGLCAAHINEVGGAAAAKSDLAANAAVSIRWEGEAGVLAKVALTDRSMSLLHIDVALKRAVPALSKEPHSFEYLYRNEGVADVFYDIFTAGVFADECNGNLTTISIRRVVDSDSVLAAYTRQGPGGGRVTHMPGQGGTMARGNGTTVSGAPLQGINSNNNPFKVKNSKKQKGSQTVCQSCIAHATRACAARC